MPKRANKLTFKFFLSTKKLQEYCNNSLDLDLSLCYFIDACGHYMRIGDRHYIFIDLENLNRYQVYYDGIEKGIVSVITHEYIHYLLRTYCGVPANLHNEDIIKAISKLY